MTNPATLLPRTKRTKVAFTWRVPTREGVKEIHFTRKDNGELCRLRFALHQRERLRRVQALRRTSFARLGPDHPALVAREIAHQLAEGRCNAAGSAETMAKWHARRGENAQAAEAQLRAVQAFQEGKKLAIAAVAAMQHATRTLRYVATAYVARLAARCGELVTFVEPLRIAPTHKVHAIASHYSAQAPPTGVERHTFTVATRLHLYERR